GPARSAAAQRIDLHGQLVAGLEGLARPTIAHQSARARAFEIPHRGAAVAALHREKDEGVRAGELEFLHRAHEVDRVLLIEHRERMVSENRTGDCQKSAACKQCRKLKPSHANTPISSGW